MAAGITQPGAAGTVTMLEDDANADADLDGDNDTYSLSDVVAKGLANADTTDLGTTLAKYFRSMCSIQNGDGTGTATTTFKMLTGAVAFDNTKTYAVSTVGQANRWTKLGLKVQGAAGNPSGQQGPRMDFGAVTTIRGNMAIYGTQLRQAAAGGLNFQPGASGLTAEIVSSSLATSSGAGNMAFGSASFPLSLMDNVNIVLGGTGVINQFFADYIARIVAAVTGSNAHFINTSGTFAVRDMVFVGTPTTSDIRCTNGAIVNPIYSGNAPQYGIIAGTFEDWFTYSPVTQFHSTGVPVSGINVRVLDSNDAIIFDMVSDALGGFHYDVGTVFENALMVRTASGNPSSVTDLWPWTVRVNMDGTVDSAYAGYEYKYSPPYVDLPSTYGRQHQPMAPDILIYPAGFFDATETTVFQPPATIRVPHIVERVTIGLTGVSAEGQVGTLTPPKKIDMRIVQDVVPKVRIGGVTE